MSEIKDDIEGYHNGMLSAAERHALEKKALRDPFLADALEGAASLPAEEFSSDVRQLHSKIRQHKTQEWFTPLRIAAGVAILISTGALYFYNQGETKLLAEKKSATAPVAADSALASAKKDSSSQLLTLAKPEETASGKASQTLQPSPVNPVKTDQNKSTAGATVAIGEIAQIQHAEAEAKPVLDEETRAQKLTVTAEEISDDRKEAVNQSVQGLSAAGAAKDQKESQAQRSAKLKSETPGQVTRTFQNIGGNVTLAEDGTPLPGVNVAVKGSRDGTVTDTQGNYRINTSMADPVLVFSYIGMHSKEVNATGQSNIDAQLKENVSELSEVVVTGTSLKQDRDDALGEPVIKTAIPLGGIKAYNTYLEKNLRYPPQARQDKIKGKVIVQFTVTKEGALTEFNVMKGLGHGCDEEVIRLVKEGPKWTPGTQNDLPVESEVRVRMRFDPEKAKE